jgi:S-DNA-T family DNA segregation ATPase FtsK/SpoIIIE
MGRHRKRKLKIKLKKETIYSIFSLGSILGGALLLLSYTQQGEALVAIYSASHRWFGALAFLAGFGIILFGFLLLRLKMVLSRPHVTIGYFVACISLLGLVKTGSVGFTLYSILAEILGTAGSDIVYVAGFIIGLVVLFDTSLDELLSVFAHTLEAISKIMPGGVLSMFKSKKMVVKDNKQLSINSSAKQPPTIKGGAQSVPALATAQKPAVTVNNKKDLQPGAVISDKLVSNVLDGKGEGIWEYPPLSLLAEGPGHKADRGDIKKIAATIERTLQSFGVDARVAEVNLGPAVTQYALEIALGTKVSKITSLANDLALATEAPTGQIRIEAPIPGRNLIGIEIPNRSLEVVTLRTMLASNTMQKSKSKLTVSLGLDVSGNPVVSDIAKMPHVLVAGTTGSGKSVAINAFITSILFRASPNEVKFIMIDPKRVEMSGYNGIPHLLTPVIVEPEKILSSLKWAVGEMDRRYKLFAERGVRNIDSYNELSGFQALPYIVIFIDELADLMMFAPVEVEDAIARIAQMARATGIHLVIATQRPSVDVITGLIKANVPCRIAFNVSSIVDSRVILDSTGAEKLLGRGDMLYVPPDSSKPSRIQGTFVSEKEVQKLVAFLKEKSPEVNYTEEVTEQPILVKKGTGATPTKTGDDALIEEAIRVVCQFDRASASLLQRKLSLGYSRAARILDQLQELGVVSPAEGSKPRDVLLRNAEDVIAKMQEG